MRIERDNFIPTARPEKKDAATAPITATPTGLDTTRYVSSFLASAAFKGSQACSADLAVIPQGQGNTNACGTTSMAMLLSFWGDKTNHFQVDSKIRTEDLPTSPDDLVRYARSQGMRATLQTGSTLEDIAKLIDQGVPVQVLYDPLSSSNPDASTLDKQDAFLHYVTVTGYERGADGAINHVSISDPGDSGSHYQVKSEIFEQHWEDLALDGIHTGINRLMIAMVPNDDRAIQGGDGQTRRASDIALPSNGAMDLLSVSKPGRVAIQGLANVTNGWHHANLGDTVGGVVQLIGGGITTLFSNIPYVGRIAPPVAEVTDLVGRGLRAAGNLVSDGIKAAIALFR